MTFRTVKPGQLSLMFRSVERNRKIYACFSVLAMSESVGGAPHLRTEASLWKTLAAQAPEFTEAAVVKSQPEYLVFGHAYGYEGQTEGVAGVKLANSSKWMRSFGERRHPDALQPAPLTKVPLHWRHAWGGPDDANNPLGVGRQRDEEGRTVLPRFERPDAPWRLDHASPQAAGFGPLDVTHPDRAKLVGTYGDDYLKTDYPGLSRDADWRFFQVAPLDQRLATDLIGDEAYELVGLQPTERRQAGRLPGIRPRVFVERHRLPEIREVECKLRTVVFLPDVGAVVQVWQGIMQIADEDGTELTHVIAGLEHLKAPREMADYAAVFSSRLDEQDGMLAMLRDEELLPQGMSFEALLPGDIDLNKPPPADSLSGRLDKKNRERIHAVRAEVASHGLDPDEHAPPLPGPREQIPPIAQLGQYFRDLDARALKQRQEAAAIQSQAQATNVAEFAARGESFDYVLKEISDTRTGPPLPNTPNLMELLTQTRRALGPQPLAGFEEVDEMLVDADLHARWQGNDQAMQRMYERSAHFQNAAPRTSGRFAQRQQRWITERLAEKKPLKGFDLTGADLRQHDLRGAVLDGAMLEAACFDGADLTGASAHGAVLAHASFVKARLDDCNFSAANLGKACFALASARRADFSGAILWESDFTQAMLRGAKLLNVEALYIKLAGADLSEAVLDEMLFFQTDLSGTQFTGASIDEAKFIENKLAGSSFAGAKARRAAFLKPDAAGLCFDGADLSGTSFVQDPKLPGASLRGTNLSKVFAHGADFKGANFSQATLDGAEFGQAQLQGADLRGVHARGTGLRFVDLSKASVVGADLRGALLGNAKLHGTRFDASSLYMTDLARIQIDTKTSFEKVNFGRARLFPRWEPPAS
jgi:uncharacterized protein YjbI with pentapeptide repeats